MKWPRLDDPEFEALKRELMGNNSVWKKLRGHYRENPGQSCGLAKSTSTYVNLTNGKRKDLETPYQVIGEDCSDGQELVIHQKKDSREVHSIGAGGEKESRIIRVCLGKTIAGKLHGKFFCYTNESHYDFKTGRETLRKASREVQSFDHGKVEGPHLIMSRVVAAGETMSRLEIKNYQDGYHHGETLVFDNAVISKKGGFYKGKTHGEILTYDRQGELTQKLIFDRGSPTQKSNDEFYKIEIEREERELDRRFADSWSLD